MMILISCAKTMAAHCKHEVPFSTCPQFEAEARDNALSMAQFPAEELARLLRVSPKLAAENRMRFHDFFSEGNRPFPALFAYTGIVFKRIAPQDFTEEDLAYAQQHLRITSFLYGLLRPLDLIKKYRMEGNIRLPERENLTMFDYWKPLLTGFFIEEIKKQGGVLVNLASGEMKDLFDWARIARETRVITPEFAVCKNGKLSTVVVYAKMCRGEMTRYLLKNRVEDEARLKAFEWEGFAYNAAESTEKRPVFTL